MYKLYHTQKKTHLFFSAIHHVSRSVIDAAFASLTSLNKFGVLVVAGCGVLLNSFFFWDISMSRRELFLRLNFSLFPPFFLLP